MFVRMKIEFKLNKSFHVLGNGEAAYSVPDEVYRDAPADVVSSLVERVIDGEIWRDLIREEIEPQRPWLAKIILHEKRNDFLKLIPEFEQEFLALDVGAGWGQHTIDISKRGNVCSIEPSPERFEFMKAICTQENTNKNCFFINSSLGQLEFKTKFDFAVSIGVLEWVGNFEECDTPRIAQLKFLKKLKRALKPEAPLVIGIENRIGLKYLIGSNDDHIGVSHISCLQYEDANRIWKNQGKGELRVATYTRTEYEQLFREAGFSDLVFYSAMPDYKIPERIVECYPNDRLSEVLSSGEYLDEHDGSNGNPCGMDDVLRSLYKTLANEKVSSLFSPSYFIVAR